MFGDDEYLLDYDLLKRSDLRRSWHLRDLRERRRARLLRLVSRAPAP